MKQVNIVIQNGHRNIQNGQTGTAGEVDLIEKVFYALSPLLIKAGLQVYYDDANLTNTKSLGDNLNYFIALHFDGSTNHSYNGGFIDDSPNDLVSAQSWKFAQTVADYYFVPMGIAYANHSTNDSKYYYGFNYTGANTKQFIIELGTLTNQNDHDKCQDYGKIARLLAQGIIAYLTAHDTTYQEYLKTTQPTTPTIPNTTEIDGIRKELEEQKKLYTKLQESVKVQLADKDKECQKRIDDIKIKIKNYIDSV